MADFIPTSEQKAAIEAKDCSLLLSAAAGSGKTAVMVQRLAALIAQGSVQADKILAITFTRAAAASMRAKLEDELAKAAERLSSEDKHDSAEKVQRLTEAVEKLDAAQISTFDAFFQMVVRRYYYLLDVNADFGIIDAGRRKYIAEKAMDGALDDASLAEKCGKLPQLKALYALVVRKNDAALRAMAEGLYTKATYTPNPQQYLDELCERYNDEAFWEAIWLQQLNNRLMCARKKADELEELIKYRGAELGGKYAETGSMLCGAFNAVYNAKSIKDIAVVSLSFKKPSTAVEDLCLKGKYDELYNYLRPCTKKVIDEATVLSSMQSKQAFANAAQAVQALVYIVKRFMLRRSEWLKKENVLDFSDCCLLAVKAVDNDAVCEELKQAYTCICVDEYQDNNRLQEYVLSRLKHNNLFLVGDVKQSIYRFRGSEPMVFTDAMRTYCTPTERLMYLTQNFRSAKSVLQGTNLIFNSIMHGDFAGIEYDENAALHTPDNSWQSRQCVPCEACDYSYDALPDGMSAYYAEALAIAGRIEQMVGNETIYDSTIKADSEEQKMRKVRYSDITVLSRTVNGITDIESIVRTVFAAKGIPLFTLSSASMLERYEINVIMSLLKVLTNRRDDVALLSVMTSPLFSLSFSQLASAVADDTDRPFCERLTDSVNPEVRQALAVLEQWRFLSATLSLESFISFVYDNTGFIDSMVAIQGDSCRGSLTALADIARTYTMAGNHSVLGFVRYMEKLDKYGEEDVTGDIPDAAVNAVRLLTIHKSKGLEFPVVFIMGCHARLTQKISNETVGDMGLQLGKDIASAVTKEDVRQKTLAEDMRLLYVGCTRAINKLILTGCKKQTKQPELPYAEDYANATSFYGWVLPVLAKQQACGALRLQYKTDEPATGNSEDWIVKVDKAGFDMPAKTEAKRLDVPELNLKRITEIDEQLRFEYKFASDTQIPSRKTATQQPDRTVKLFEITDGVSAARRGSAIHTVLEHTDFVSARATADKLLEHGLLTLQEYEQIDFIKLDALFATPLIAQITAHPNKREAPFTMADEDGSLVQGIIDCFYIDDDGEAVLIDFKSDRVHDNTELIKQRYTPQIIAYKKALERCFGLTCKKAMLCLTDTATTVDIDINE